MHALCRTCSNPHRSERFRLTLNTDGRTHPRRERPAVSTLICGLVAFVADLLPRRSRGLVLVGTLGFGLGLYSQYISATTPQRSLNIIGIVASFVGVALGIAHGGFLPRDTGLP